MLEELSRKYNDKDMKANELMIGDWVLDGNVYAQVTSITCDGNVETTHNEHSNIELIEPIPLEKIHLAKNGFDVRYDTDDMEFFYNDGYEVKVMFDDGLPEEDIPPIIYLTIEFAEKSNAMPIEYLHELQQAMRIMGCDKEIKL